MEREYKKIQLCGMFNALFVAIKMGSTRADMFCLGIK